METREKKTSMGRQKIEIKKIEKRSQLQVTFSKRRKGIFKKAGELSLLCGVDVAVIVTSPAGKIFTFGNPSPDAVVDRFLAGNSSTLNTGEDHRVKRQLRVEKHVTPVGQLEEEKVRDRVAHGASGDGFWWDMPVDGLGLEELKQHMAALELLKGNIMARVDEMTVAADDGLTSTFLDCAASASASATVVDPSSFTDGLSVYDYINDDNTPLI